MCDLANLGDAAALCGIVAMPIWVCCIWHCLCRKISKHPPVGAYESFSPTAGLVTICAAPVPSNEKAHHAYLAWLMQQGRARCWQAVLFLQASARLSSAQASAQQASSCAEGAGSNH